MPEGLGPAERGPVLHMTGIDKRFPGVQALSEASLEVLPGEVHGLVGENGAGKSTIIKILAGVHLPDAGQIVINGQSLAAPSPHAVHELGVRFSDQLKRGRTTQPVGHLAP